MSNITWRDPTENTKDAAALEIRAETESCVAQHYKNTKIEDVLIAAGPHISDLLSIYISLLRYRMRNTVFLYHQS
jgi:hypothetical protein